MVIVAVATRDWLSSTVTVATLGTITVLTPFRSVSGLRNSDRTLAIKKDLAPRGMATLTGTAMLSLVKMVNGAVPPEKINGMLVVQSPVVIEAGKIDGGIPVSPVDRTVTFIITVLPVESTIAIGAVPAAMLLIVRVVPARLVVATLILPLVAV